MLGSIRPVKNEPSPWFHVTDDEIGLGELLCPLSGCRHLERDWLPGIDHENIRDWIGSNNASHDSSWATDARVESSTASMRGIDPPCLSVQTSEDHLANERLHRGRIAMDNKLDLVIRVGETHHDSIRVTVVGVVDRENGAAGEGRVYFGRWSWVKHAATVSCEPPDVSASRQASRSLLHS